MAESAPCKRQSDTTMEDWISKMPDAILSSILSLLPIREAGRTSVLSTRWPNLWKSTSCLNFDALPEEIEHVRLAWLNEYKKPLRSNYVRWVNQVLGSHELPSLDEFKVQFDLNASFSDDIDEWIKFMIRKRTKRMEIDFSRNFGTDDIYSLSQECNDFFKSSSNLSNIMCLRSLILGMVNVEGELIEYFLSKCPHLELLSITGSKKLFSLKVAGPSLPLKHLKLSRCDSLKNIELSAPSLVTFSYTGDPVKFVLGRNPLLSELHLHKVCCLPLFSSYYSQIETLSLRVCFKIHLELPHVSDLKNLKHLIWKIDAISDTSLIGVTKFIMAAPCLEKLTLQLRVLVPSDLSPSEELTVDYHEGLKEVEMYGYIGCRNNLELARYLVKSAINLEKMVIDQSSPTRVIYPEEIEKVAKLVAEQAVELIGSLPPRAELIVL